MEQRITQKDFDSLSETMRNYQLPTLVITAGVLLSIVGFILGLNSNMKALERGFQEDARVQQIIFTQVLNAYFRDMELMRSFYLSSDAISEKEFDSFAEPLFSRGKVNALFLVPYDAKKPEHLLTLHQSIAQGQKPLPENMDLAAYPEIMRGVKKALQIRKRTISEPFSFFLDDPAKANVALLYPIYTTNKLKGFVVGIIDLKRMVKEELNWHVDVENVAAYVFDVTDRAYPHLVVAQESEGIILEDNSALTPVPDYNALKTQPPFRSQNEIKVLDRTWEVFFVPTYQYFSQAAHVLPWVVLISGLLLTTAIGVLYFQQVSRNVAINRRVMEGTQLYRQTAAKLAESENRMRAILDNTVDCLVTISEDGTIETYNKACERIFGYTAPEAIGNNIGMLMPGAFHSEEGGFFHTSKESGEGRSGTGREVTGRTKDGVNFPTDVSVSEVVLEDRTIYSGIVRDITERKRSEQEINRAIEKLLESNTELEHFAYIASHDLQEPLRMVTNFTMLLAKRYGDKLDGKGLEYLKITGDAATRMQMMVSDLLEYARLSEEAERLTTVDCELELTHVLENLNEAIRERQAVITHQPLPVIAGNPVRFSRLIQNLIGNALKYQKENEPPRIHIGLRDLGDMWEFSVEDNGIGMKQEYFEKIFQPFKRLHVRHQNDGTGIGLAICKKIVENRGGKIWVHSEPGVGSTFCFTMPKVGMYDDRYASEQRKAG